MNDDATANLPAVWDDPPQEWDEQTLTLLRQDEPETVSDLILVPTYSQSAWDRRLARQIRQAEECEQYLQANIDELPGELLIRNCLLHLGYDRAATQILTPGGQATPTAIEGAARRAVDAVPPQPTEITVTPQQVRNARRRRSTGKAAS